MVDTSETRNRTRERLVEVAAEILAEHGRAAVTTRAVAERAGVQAPTIYRLFGDKDGLLDALAEHVMTKFAVDKADAVAQQDGADLDAVEDLRAGWEMTVEFGIANPELFVLLSDPARGRNSPAAQAGIGLLADRVHRVALAGRLRIGEDRAVELIHAAGTGAILGTLLRPAEHRDRRLADDMFDAVVREVLTGSVQEATAGSAVAAAVALRARAAELDGLSAGERSLLSEWLDRVIASQ